MADTEPENKHVYVRYIIMPVNVFMGEDKEPHLEYDREEIKKVLDEPDTRVGCLVCCEPLDTAWETDCPGPIIDMDALTAQVSEATGD